MSISKLLVANRGEIAPRIIRTARAMDIATVAVFSDPDAGLPYVAEADEAVRLPGAAPADTYLRGEALIAAAAATGADAVHPGYGFLSENAGFARACAAAGLTSSGRAGGHRGDGLQDRREGADGGARACPVLPSAVRQCGARRRSRARPGRAAQGRGGHRLSRCWSRRPSAAVAGACGSWRARTSSRTRWPAPGARPRRRSATAPCSSSGTWRPRAHRGADPRRHARQRRPPVRAGVLDPAPLPEDHRGGAVPRRDDQLRAGLCQAAVAAGQAIGYVGAGTVEFVLDRRGRFYFLEVNTRLQVEHPVTELVTGLDLVAAAAGDRRWPAAAARRSPGPASPATPSRPGCTPRTCPPATCPPAATCTRWRSARRTASGWTRASRTARWSARTTTRCWPR